MNGEGRTHGNQDRVPMWRRDSSNPSHELVAVPAVAAVLRLSGSRRGDGCGGSGCSKSPWVRDVAVQEERHDIGRLATELGRGVEGVRGFRVDMELRLR